MPSIKDAIRANQARIAGGGATGTGPASPTAAPVVAPMPQSGLAPILAPSRGNYPASFVLGGDINDSNPFPRQSNMRSSAFVNTPQQIKTSPVISTPTSEIVAPSVAGLTLETNNILNPNQKLQNIIGNGIDIEANPDGSVVFTVPQSSSNAFSLIDNFHGAIATSNISGTIPLLGIGELGWTLQGSTGNQGGIIGGTFPNVGQYGWANSDTASQAGWLALAGSGSYSTAGYSQQTYGLADTPGAFLTYVFKLDAAGALASNVDFDATNLAMYVGVTGPNIGGFVGASVSRPNFFIGVRYDVSSPLSDSFFTLEVVSNPVTTLSTYIRDNTQGTTFVTDVAPDPGTWHTLTIDFTVAGQVTLTLDGTQTLTAAIPVLTVTGTISALAQNGAARLNWTVSGTAPQSFWNAGSIVTVSGFTSTLIPFNGVQSLTASDESFIGFDLPGVNTLGNGTATLSGFPSMTPLYMMGNASSTPSAQNLILFVADYFSLIWNPIS